MQYQEIIDEIRLVELNAQYKLLSEAEEHFPRKSKSKIALFVDKKMTEVCNEIDDIKYRKK